MLAGWIWSASIGSKLPISPARISSVIPWEGIIPVVRYAGVIGVVAEGSGIGNKLGFGELLITVYPNRRRIARHTKTLATCPPPDKSLRTPIYPPTLSTD